jgi:hypothetical protein
MNEGFVLLKSAAVAKLLARPTLRKIAAACFMTFLLFFVVWRMYLVAQCNGAGDKVSKQAKLFAWLFFR